MRKFIGLAFVIFAASFFSAPAQAACEKAADGTISLSGTELGRCTADALEVSATFTFYGVCRSFPTNGTDLSSCENILTEDLELAISKGSEQEVDAIVPPIGSYPYTLAIVKTDMKLQGVLKFAHNVTGGDGTNAVNQSAEGAYCQPPNFEWTTETIFSDIYPTQCSASEPTQADLNTGNFRVTNVGLLGWSAIRSYKPESSQMNPQAMVNLVLLDSNGQLAVENGDIASLVLIGKPETPAIFEEGGSSINADFSTVNGFGFTYRCNGEGQACTIFTPYLGGGAFASSISTDK